MRYGSRQSAIVSLLAAWAMSACSQTSAEAGSASDKGAPFNTSGSGSFSPGSGGSSNAGASGTGGSSAVVDLPPEMEVEKTFQAPVATARYVWSANPKSGRVALIDAETYQVQTVAAGAGPTFISAIPGAQDRAIVLNVLSSDATLLTREDGAITQRTFQVAEQANSWAISPDGHWAIAWTDVTQVKNPDKIEGFQTISIIDLTKTDAVSAAVRRTVGFRPSSISFAVDPPRALAVTEDGISIVDLTGGPGVKKVSFDVPADRPDGGTPDDAGPRVDAGDALPAKDAGDAGVPSDAGPSDAGVPSDAGPGLNDAGDAAANDANASDASASDANDANASDANANDANAVLPDATTNTTTTTVTPETPGKADVSISPNGAYAIVRRQGSSVVTLIDLATSARTSWTLAGPVTDLDLSSTGDRAVAVVRSAGRIAVLPVPAAGTNAFDDLHVEGETVGSVVITPGGETAILYTNAVAIPRLTVVDLLPTPASRTIELHAPVLSVYPSPTATHAVVLHDSWKGTAFQSPGAFSLVPLSGIEAAVIRPTDAPPRSVAISPTGNRALISVRDDKTKIYGAYLARMDSLAIDRYALASPPTAAGFVGNSGLGFIAQDHPDGRITFIEPETGRVRTITGFELGASVVEWSTRDGGR